MKNGNYTKAKVLTLIPIFVLVITVICFALAVMLEGATNRGTLYTIFALAGLISMFISPLPCLVVSIIGTVFAAKAKKEGEAAALKFLILGIFEILAYILSAILAVVMFIVGMGV